MLRVVKLSIRFVLYRSADDSNDDDALKLSCSADVSLLPSLLFRATREKLSNSRERMYGSVTSEEGNGQWAMVGTCTVVRELWNWSNARPPSGWETASTLCSPLALSLSLSHRVSVSLWRKSCAGICVSQARFEFCMNCISSLKNENKAANYLKFDNLLDPTYLCFNRLSSVPEMTSPLLEWCQLFIYVKQFDIPSPLPKAKGQMHIMRALYDLRDFYINTNTHTHTHTARI